MLKLPRRRGAGSGWLSPRNDGPLMTGVASDGGSELRGATARGAAPCAGTICGVTPLCRGAAAGVAGARTVADWLAALSAVAAATGTASVSSFAPHMPQKRFASEFSLPQRAQRNRSLLISLSIAYDILNIRCSTNPGAVLGRYEGETRDKVAHKSAGTKREEAASKVLAGYSRRRAEV